MMIICTQYNLLENTQTILAKGIGHLEGDVLSYTELDHPENRHEILFTDGKVVLKRTADIHSETVLYKNQLGASKMESEYGTALFDTECIQMSQKEEEWMVEYKILHGREVVTHQKLVWELQPMGKA